MRGLGHFVIACMIFFAGPEMTIDEWAFAGRPLQTEDGGVAGHKKLQLESGFDSAFKSGDEDYNFILTPIAGVTDRLEFSTDFPVSFVRPDDGENTEGFSDFGLSAKALLLEEKDILPAMLVKGFVKFANGNFDRSLGSGDEDFGVVAVATKSLNPFTLHANVGYRFTGDSRDEELEDTILYGMACEYSLNPRISFVGELFVECGDHFDLSAFQHRVWNPLLGMTFRLSEKIVWDIAFRVGLEEDKEPEYGIVSGLTINFN